MVAIVGFALALADRRRKRGGTERITTQNIYVAQSTPQPLAGASGGGTPASPPQAMAEDVRYVLLLEACLRLASDLHLIWPTLGEKRRSIVLIKRFMPELEHDATTFAAQLDAGSGGTAEAIHGLLVGAFKEYLEVMRVNIEWSEHRDDGEREPEQMEHERKSLHYAFATQHEEIEGRLRSNRTYLSALAEQEKSGSWKILGFASPEDFAEYLRPTMRSLTSSPGDLAEDVLQRLLAAPQSLRDLEQERVPSSIRVELVNRLLADNWAELTPEGKVALNDAGARLLEKRLAAWRTGS
ncbi:MAG TPA: hypothetical protein VHI77_11970 [Solirubrobacterales bacterium]|nr:hypothetical protein [Solirubrobacterales bacterium]